MRAVVCQGAGGVEVLELRDVPNPEPRPDEVLVRNFATALNRADLLQRRGLYPPPPGESEILGLEFAGEVAAVGSKVLGFGVGDRVFGLTGGGGYAELLTAHWTSLLPIPDTLSYDAAAAVPEAFFTAHESLFTLGRLAEREVVLVHAGASGVGAAAIQLARARGAVVAATVGSAEKAAACAAWGASCVVNYRSEDFVAAVRGLGDGSGAHLILDLVGAKYWERNIETLRDGGRLIVVGLLGGAKVTADLWTILRRRLQILGTAMRGRSREDKAAIARRCRDEVLPLLETGIVRPVIDRVYPLEEVRAAHERMEANLNTGKIVLRM